MSQYSSFSDYQYNWKNHKKYKKRSVFIGDLPIMTNRGTFIISGIERVIVNQIIRSPGIYYKQEINKVRLKRFKTMKKIEL